MIGGMSGIISKTKKVATHVVSATAEAIDAHILSPGDHTAVVDRELQKGAELSVIKLIDTLIERAHANASGAVATVDMFSPRLFTHSAELAYSYRMLARQMTERIFLVWSERSFEIR